MYSGDAPPSFSSGSLKPFDQQDQYQVDQQSWQNQPPSQGSMGHGQGNSVNHFQDGTTYRGLAQPDSFPVGDDEKMAPSFTALGHGQGISHNSDGISTREYGGVNGEPLSISAMVKGAYSNPSGGGGGGGGDHYGDDKAPSRSDLAKREHSNPGGSSSTDMEMPSDPQEFVGMSLVGKNFKKYYPNAYYKEKNEN